MLILQQRIPFTQIRIARCSASSRGSSVGKARDPEKSGPLKPRGGYLGLRWRARWSVVLVRTKGRLEWMRWSLIHELLAMVYQEDVER
jgi:hypothetical protein